MLAQVVDAIVPIIGLLLSWASVELARWIRARIRSERAKTALLSLNEVARSVVSELNETIVSHLKEAGRDGKLTREEIQAIREEAESRALRYLGERGVRELATIVQGELVGEFLRAKLEQTVQETRRGDSPPSGGAPLGSTAPALEVSHGL